MSGAGSGFVISDEGFIVTNNHVVEDADRLEVTLANGRTVPARLIGRDPRSDLAVVKVDVPKEQLSVARLGSSTQLEIGEPAIAIGNPFGLDRTVTAGIISGRRAVLDEPAGGASGRATEPGLLIDAIQTDASINPGNSGGPLLDSQGRMIGINSQILSPDGGGSVGVGFAVPVNIARRIVPQLIREGRVVRPRLGVYPRAVSDLRGVRLPAQSGLLIVELDPNGSAAAAGLRGLSESPAGDLVIGDIITAIDGEKVESQNDLYRIMDKHQFNDVVQVEVVRGDGQRATVPVRLLPERTQRGTTRRM
jgi:putative serine protease PepD